MQVSRRSSRLSLLPRLGRPVTAPVARGDLRRPRQPPTLPPARQGQESHATPHVPGRASGFSPRERDQGQGQGRNHEHRDEDEGACGHEPDRADAAAPAGLRGGTEQRPRAAAAGLRRPSEFLPLRELITPPGPPTRPNALVTHVRHRSDTGRNGTQHRRNSADQQAERRLTAGLGVQHDERRAHSQHAGRRADDRRTRGPVPCLSPSLPWPRPQPLLSLNARSRPGPC